MNVLVIEDENLSRLTLRRILSHLQVKVTEAANGEEALELLPSAQPDLILLDLGLPGIDGYETLSRIRSLEGFTNTPVVCISASKDLSAIVKLRELGITDYLVKPIRADEANARLRDALQVAATRKSGRT